MKTMRCTIGIVMLFASMVYASDPPTFESYKVSHLFSGKHGSFKIDDATFVNKATDPAKLKTELQEAGQKEPNFAGKYRIVTWSCGSACEDFAFIDLETGTVYKPSLVNFLIHPLAEGTTETTREPGLAFKSDSSLLIMTGIPDGLKSVVGTYYFSFENGELKLLYEEPFTHVQSSPEWQELVRNGDLDSFKKLLDQGMKIDAAGDHGQTPLHIAAQAGHDEMVAFLLDKSAPIDATDEFGESPLFKAVSQNHIACVATLCNKGARVDITNTKGRSSIFFVNNIVIAKPLLEKGANIKQVDQTHFTPLHFVAFRKNVEVARLLIENGADVNAGDPDYPTPLHRAAYAGSTGMVELLIEKGALINTGESTGIPTPLYEAIRCVDQASALQIVTLLLDRGAHPNARAKNGWAPLHELSWQKSTEVAQILLDKGAEINLPDFNGDSPLMSAVTIGNRPYVEWLLEHNADTTVVNNSGNSALHIAAANGDGYLVKLLLRKTAAIDQKNKQGYTPFHLAVQAGSQEVLEILFANKVDVTLTDNEGNSALTMAQNRADSPSKTTLIQWLKAHGVK